MDFSFQAIIQQHTSQMDYAFRSLVDTIVRQSKLSVSLLRISNVTEDSLHVSLEARITKAGPVSANLSSMLVELHGPAGQFGTITLPAITTQANGTDVVVNSQIVNIVDKPALKAFIREVMEEKSTVLSLRNGQTSVAAMGMAPRAVVYEKDIELAGMSGPVISLHAVNVNPTAEQLSAEQAPGAVVSSQTIASIVTASGGGVNAVIITLQVLNPSPLEISFGICSFEIVDHHGTTLAELKGRLDIRGTCFEITVQGTVNRPVTARFAEEMRAAVAKRAETGEKTAEPGVFLVGKRCAGAGWCDETVKAINVPLQNVRRLFVALEMGDVPVEEPNVKRASLRKLTSWMMR